MGADVSKEDVEVMTTQSIIEFLASVPIQDCGFSAYEEAVRAQNIDGKFILKSNNREELKQKMIEMGMTKKHANLLSSAVARFIFKVTDLKSIRKAQAAEIKLIEAMTQPQQIIDFVASAKCRKKEHMFCASLHLVIDMAKDVDRSISEAFGNSDFSLHFVTCLNTFISSSAACEKCCVALQYLIRRDGESYTCNSIINNRALGRAGANQAVLDILTFHIGDPAVVLQALKAIRFLAGDDDNRSDCSRFESCKIVMDALRRHVTEASVDSDIAEQAMHSLYNFTLRNTESSNQLKALKVKTWLQKNIRDNSLMTNATARSSVQEILNNL